MKKDLYKEAAAAIDAFDWTATKEGFEFWCDIHSRLISQPKEVEPV